MAVVAIALGFGLRIDTPSWLAVIVCIGMMFALETVNTAIEAVVDLASPGYHELARRAKDCAAGAALRVPLLPLWSAASFSFRRFWPLLHRKQPF